MSGSMPIQSSSVSQRVPQLRPRAAEGFRRASKATTTARVIVRGMSHVSFPVRDLARALSFYRDLLGFAEIPRPDLGVPGAWLRAGDADVHLIAGVEGLPLGAPPPMLNPAAQHVAFRIDDYEAAATRLRDSGLDVLESGPAAGQMWVQDPDGHVIELIAVTR